MGGNKMSLLVGFVLGIIMGLAIKGDLDDFLR